MTTNNSEQNNLLMFAEDKAQSSSASTVEPWRVLVVDDEKDVHDMTRLVLSGFTFQNRHISMDHAHSAEEAKKKIAEQPDTALIILDVVMESDDAGLKLVRHIRETLENEYVRIILRTGQPGQAPEQKVIVDYDINDYKGKSDLTSQKLITSVITALRSYSTIMAVAKLNDELEMKVEERTAELHTLNIDLESSLRKLQDDESAGRAIQMKMLPADPEFISPFLFHRILIPSLQLSGDFVDYFRVNENTLAFYLADVSGHGVASAFVTVMLKSFIRHYLELYMSRGDDTIVKPDILLGKLNEELLKENLGKHMTMFYGLLDSANFEMTYVNCGHFPIPTIRKNRIVEHLAGKSPAIGLFDFSTYTPKTVEFPPESQILLFSDGFLEVLEQNDFDEKCKFIAEMQKDGVVDLSRLAHEFKLDTDRLLPDDITALTVQATRGEF